jgi:hypothetical protein
MEEMHSQSWLDGLCRVNLEDATRCQGRTLDSHDRRPSNRDDSVRHPQGCKTELRRGLSFSCFSRKSGGAESQLGTQRGRTIDRLRRWDPVAVRRVRCSGLHKGILSWTLARKGDVD